MATSSWEGWSGLFWQTREGTGYMSVHYDDERLHKPPEGWDLVEVHGDEEAETYVYRNGGTGSVPPVPVPQSDQRTADL